MIVFYWVMGLILVGTLAPALLYFVLYLVTGEREAERRGRAFWNATRVFILLGFNTLVWGHVLVGLWGIWFG